MKKFFLFVAFAIMAVTTQAQTLKGSLRELALDGHACIKVDYSKANIYGMSETEFAMYDMEYAEDRGEVEEEFIEEFCEHLGGSLLCSPYSDSPFTIVAQMKSVTDHGTTTCDLHVYKRNASGKDVKVASITGFKRRGGYFDSKADLMKDGAENVGKACGNYLRTALFKAGR